ncbi:MAG: ABC transporter ATP-binding protein [Planctomycetota bacterium]|jgi:putative ABC transport system ATP-binding protein
MSDPASTDRPADSRTAPGTVDSPARAAPAQEALLAANVVRAVGVKRVFHLGEQEVVALRGVDLSVKRAEYVSIMGPSGSGKTTLFNMIGGLDKPDEGQVFIDEVNIAALDTFELAWLRCHKIGYIFQTFDLLTVASALENVMLPMLFAGLSQADAQDKAAGLLARVGLGERLLHKPSELSGGQQQRVAVARALANDPAILLADEPTGNLDLATGEEIIRMLGSLKEDFGVTVITATHDYKMLAASDKVVILTSGQVTSVRGRDELDITVGTIDGSETR